MTGAFGSRNDRDIGEGEITWQIFQGMWRNPDHRIGDSQLLRLLSVCTFVRFRDQRTNDKKERIRLLTQRDCKGAQQVVDPLKRIQNARVHDNRAAIELILLSKLFRLRMIEQIRLNPRRHHVDLCRRNAVS